jgi:nucleoside-diphosphate-sugar epimerase
MMAEVAAGELCLVTGGTGFVATHVIEALIAAGHKVRATVRSLSDQDKCQWLESRHVQPVAADLMSSKGWAESLENVTYVFHVASPFKLNVKDGRKELVEPAINGTRNLLEACLASKTLKRVVLTSSVAAIAPEGGKVAGSLPELGENGWTGLLVCCIGLFCDEQHLEHAWNYLANLKDSPYPLSKVEAERFACESSKRSGLLSETLDLGSFVGMHKSSISWDLVSVNPSAIFGPILFPPKSVAEVNTSNTVIEKVNLVVKEISCFESIIFFFFFGSRF